MLASFAMGIHSERFRAMTDQEIADEAIRNVAQIHDKPETYLKSILVKSVVKKFGDDPYAGAALLLPYPYHVILLFNIISQTLINQRFQYSHHHDDLKRPEGRLYFAGDHTEIIHGVMDSAIKSGIRAAIEIHNDEDWTELYSRT